jgi:putative phage-type endonuclease
LEVRKRGIGSSDAAAAVGLNPYKSQLELWLEKTGRNDPSDEHQGMDDPRFWGTLLEQYVAVAYQQKTSRKVRRLNAVLQHLTFTFMLANIDREVVGSPDVQILECKTAGEFGSRLWKDGVPEYVLLQVQHQLAVTGKAAADVDQEIAAKERDAERLKQTIQQAMGDASKATFANGVVTFKRAKDGSRINTKALAAAHPEIAARYIVTTPGSRRFLLSRQTDTTERSATCSKGL